MNTKANYEAEKLTALVVDDHPQMRKAVAKVLTKMEFGEILEVGNGSEAIKILQEKAVDLIILDLYLLDVSGFEVLEYIRNREVDPDIPVLVVTGEASKDEIVKAADQGANDYLLKPFQPDDLMSKCTTLLSKYYSPSPLVSFIRKAERMFLEKRYANAVVAIEEAIQKDSTSVRARYIKAIILDKLGQNTQAVALLKECAELNENFYRVHAALADIYIAQRKQSEAIDAMSKELELNPKQPKRQTQLGTLLLGAGRIEDSINHFREALKENVKFRLALFGMGRAYATIGNLEKAVYYYKRLRRYYPTNTKALEAIVKCCIDAEDPIRAEHALKDEKNTNKKCTDVYLVLGKFYLATDRKQDALAILDELLVREPQNTEAFRLKAVVHCHYQEYPAAIEQYVALLKINEDYASLIGYADVLMHASQFATASTVLHKCFTHQFDWSDVFRRLAICSQNQAEAGKAYLIYKLTEKKYGVDADSRAGLEDCQKHLLGRRSGANKRIAS